MGQVRQLSYLGVHMGFKWPNMHFLHGTLLYPSKPRSSSVYLSPAFCQAGPSTSVLSKEIYTFVPGAVLSTAELAGRRADMVLGFKRLLSNGKESGKNHF